VDEKDQVCSAHIGMFSNTLHTAHPMQTNIDRFNNNGKVSTRLSRRLQSIPIFELRRIWMLLQGKVWMMERKDELFVANDVQQFLYTSFDFMSLSCCPFAGMCLIPMHMCRCG